MPEHDEMADGERRQALKEIGEALANYVDVLEKWRAHPGRVGSYIDGQYLPQVLDLRELGVNGIHHVLNDPGHDAEHPESTSPLLERARARARLVASLGEAHDGGQ